MSEFGQLDKTLATLIETFSSKSRAQLTRIIIRKLRQRQQSRIQQQISPSGTPYVKRKSKERRVMFRRLRTVRFMKTTANSNGGRVYFYGNSDYIARVHHYGLRDKVNKKRRLEVKYERRELLGITPDDIQMINDEMLSFIINH